MDEVLWHICYPDFGVPGDFVNVTTELLGVRKRRNIYNSGRTISKSSLEFKNPLLRHRPMRSHCFHKEDPIALGIEDYYVWQFVMLGDWKMKGLQRLCFNVEVLLRSVSQIK